MLRDQQQLCPCGMCPVIASSARVSTATTRWSRVSRRLRMLIAGSLRCSQTIAFHSPSCPDCHDLRNHRNPDRLRACEAVLEMHRGYLKAMEYALRVSFLTHQDPGFCSTRGPDCSLDRSKSRETAARNLRPHFSNPLQFSLSRSAPSAICPRHPKRRAQRGRQRPLSLSGEH